MCMPPGTLLPCRLSHSGGALTAPRSDSTVCGFRAGAPRACSYRHKSTAVTVGSIGRMEFESGSGVPCRHFNTQYTRIPPVSSFEPSVQQTLAFRLIGHADSLGV